MSDEFENVDLAGYSLDISDINNFFLHKNFDGNFFPRKSMGGHFDFAESSFTDSLAQQVIANFFMLVTRLLIHMKQIS